MRNLQGLKPPVPHFWEEALSFEKANISSNQLSIQ